MKNIYNLLCAVLIFYGPATWTESSMIRWTGSDDLDGTFEHVLQVLGQKLGQPLDKGSFLLEEDRDLAFTHYSRWVQVSDSTPVHGKSIRIWTDRNSRQLVQVEASIATAQSIRDAMRGLSGKNAKTLATALTSERTMALIRSELKRHGEDPTIVSVSWKDEWRENRLFRTVKIRSKHGTHEILINLLTKKIHAHKYREFPQGDLSRPDEEQTLLVQVYPVYEESEDGSPLLPRVLAPLRYINSFIPAVNGDIYAPLKNQRYFIDKYSPTLGLTEQGRAQGYWTMSYVKDQAAKIRATLPEEANHWSRGVLLQGRYATINIHPNAIQQFAPTSFQAQPSAALFPVWRVDEDSENPVEEMIPSTAFSGKPIFSAQEAFNRPARRLADHDPASYLNDGFDEIQVYYGINVLFENLKSRGFIDPELSTRPFNAFLYDPDISYRDNAYYTDDTINFTTYSPGSDNAARNNTTIWHELGHGVMERLMGESLELADTGGLSEGMADFIAAMVLRGQMKGARFPGSDLFRIINHTGFFLTNEVHDDGEAYGGAMKDFMDGVIQAYGEAGLDKVADVVLEAMRLTRDYPGLTANEWFNHLMFADSLGRAGVRAPGELSSFILAALAGRNFRLDNGPVAEFKVTFANQDEPTPIELVGDGSCSRNNPGVISRDTTTRFNLAASIKGSSDYQFHFPVELRVQYNGGPLQGALHWVGEENGTQSYTINSEEDLVNIPIEVNGTCDRINTPTGGCVDFVYLQIWNHNDHKPVAKKRFYLKAG